MDNKNIIHSIISSYNNHYDLENRFPSFLDGKIGISTNVIKDLESLKKDIINEKNRHESKCPNKNNCGTSMSYDKSIEIIENRIQKFKPKNKFKIFITKFWWLFIIPLVIGIILILVQNYYK